MESIGRFLTALALVATLLLGAVSEVHAHGRMDHPNAVGTDPSETPCSGHDHRQAAPCSAADPDRSHATEMAAPCCQNLGVPIRIDTAFSVIEVRHIVWYRGPGERFDTRRITPESPPPKPLR